MWPPVIVRWSNCSKLPASLVSTREDTALRRQQDAPCARKVIILRRPRWPFLPSHHVFVEVLLSRGPAATIGRWLEPRPRDMLQQVLELLSCEPPRSGGRLQDELVGPRERSSRSSGLPAGLSAFARGLSLVIRRLLGCPTVGRLARVIGHPSIPRDAARCFGRLLLDLAAEPRERPRLLRLAARGAMQGFRCIDRWRERLTPICAGITRPLSSSRGGAPSPRCSTPRGV